MRKCMLLGLLAGTLAGPMVLASPQPRFVENGDGTVTDNATSLMWQKEDDNITRDWESALGYCETLVMPAGGHTDWRLPSIKELRSIVDCARSDPAINTKVFPGTKPTYYWSSSTRAGSGEHTVCVHFDEGEVTGYLKTNTAYVRCVR